MIALILNKKNRKFNVALTIRYIGIAILMFGIISFGISSVIYGILFTVIETSTLNIMYKIKRKQSLELKEEGDCYDEFKHHLEFEIIKLK